MKKIRIGIFGRKTSPADGGADTFLGTLNGKVASFLSADLVEMVQVPWSAWAGRRRSLWYLRYRIGRYFGGTVPEVDLRPVCRRLRLDIAYFATPAFAHIDIPFVFTLWDIGHRTIPEFPEVRRDHDEWTLREALCQRMLAQASFVVVGNNAGAEEACEMFGLSRERVIPIPFPNPDFSRIDEDIPKWLPERPFFFYPAQFWPHKNHATLLHALAWLSANNKPVPDLVFVGSDKGNLEYLKSMADSLQVADRVHFAGFVPRGELKTLYRKAVALTFPSLLGPNNLPPQEAAVLDCPIILSDLPGHREQLADGAIYVPPLDAASWGNAMAKLMSEPEHRLALAARAKMAVKGYTAEAYASRLGRLFSSLAARRLLWGN
ncbi:MAG TPA: glycosyltransferase family 1 protein [Opitutaceae bacterium]|jgi:glycosyltransferase involved in cell wall biosynthesis|nr:glycosyltransferase family 1 protein [Opitutaceae bacterium]